MANTLPTDLMQEDVKGSLLLQRLSDLDWSDVNSHASSRLDKFWPKVLPRLPSRQSEQ
jgi:hypothetical protein